MGQVSKTFRLIFLLWNILYFAIGVVMFAFGIFVIVDLNQYGFFTEEYYIAGAVVFILVGVVKMVFGVVGVIAMFGKWRRVLGVYIAVVIVLMLLTFAAAIYGFLRRVDAYDISRDRLTTAYEDCADHRSDIDTIQEEFDCCGVNAESFNTRLDQQEYMDCTDPILADCSSTRNTNATTLRWGCLVYLTQEIQGDLYDLGAIGMAFGTFELTALLIAMQNLEGL